MVFQVKILGGIFFNEIKRYENHREIQRGNQPAVRPESQSDLCSFKKSGRVQSDCKQLYIRLCTGVQSKNSGTKTEGGKK